MKQGLGLDNCPGFSPLPAETHMDGGAAESVLGTLSAHNGWQEVKLRLTREAALLVLERCPEITIEAVCTLTYPEA
ncbi:MAG: hypothetical protein PHY34_02905 [Patescibacteria group bacterium]|nr:hypothetical protein [Patescibacteria group bacterium]MDD5715407.1 hypothetical protein [Patescibacteria group bacterium]